MNKKISTPIALSIIIGFTVLAIGICVYQTLPISG